jgi:TATA-box binding protein (TBP) (component of TFIID and TFIIIB)
MLATKTNQDMKAHEDSINKSKDGDSLVFPKFEDIKVSTKTFIVMTNLIIDLNKLFDFLPITEYTAIPKKRGRKKKLGIVEQTKEIPHGSIVTLKHENKIRGVDLKQKKPNAKKKKSKWFRNSFTVVMILNDKPVNFKICKNGMLQATGVKLDSQAEDCIKIIWDQIKDHENVIYKFSRKTHLESMIVPAMRNIDFSLGFNVDREKLSRYMSTQTEFHSLLETSFGYTGVNVKIPLTDLDITKMIIKKLSFKSDSWVEEMTVYNEYMQYLSEKEQIKKLNKDRYNTFLIFHSGRVILSSINAEYSRDSYYYFLKIIRKCYKEIEERLDL